MGSAIPGAIDYLFEGVTALPQCASPVVVSDGFPVTRTDLGVEIGVSPDDGDTANEASFAQLGGQQEDDVSYIPCVVRAKASGERAQKRARDQAFVIFDAIRAFVRANATLGGLLQTGWAHIPNHSLRQPNTPEDAAEGRKAEIFFVVQIRHRF